ncbi:molybdopterin-synthase adenylyltransferase MoeB [Pseudoalteromonas sp. MMG010]|uniref:HesA/MoeB/ThiF family protein n=1 Tax=Pseudoalteromonas sp. MMG010 TaxID=2822685 RepID=UPI001B3A4522|nr:molybdopterin-synthase adenylyltransferase MoeB [Pseudoalteromonas sp. MMG010]MBQ4832268.1 molybdopterin-synthase adenylyltransferase MoeB [Pseudoalteromonas sp. MMG010]
MNKPPLTYQQQLRYSRHIMLPSLDIAGQERLWQSHAVILGVGGLGCAVAQYLTASGVGELTLIDNDIIESHNLQRQILFNEQHVNQSKCEAAKQQLNQLNSEITINALTHALSDDSHHEELICRADIIIDCSDNLETRNLLNELCFKYKKPLVSGSAIRMEGHVACFTMQPDSHCYGCISQFISGQSQSCSESGVLSPVVGLIGSVQATEAVKILAGLPCGLSEHLLLLDALSMSFNKFKITKSPQCSVCS